MAVVSVVPTRELPERALTEIRHVLEVAFAGRFDGTDWEHTVGGLHVLACDGGELVAHAAVVPRQLVVGERRLATGYVEGVATRPAARGRGYASRVMQAAGEAIRAEHALGALSADVPELYARLGWEHWLGPTFVDAPGGRTRTPEDDGGVMVLRTARTGELDLTAGITCDWRAGDVW
jgi:aminoglycoside 2'-N-acetyltransferase I